MAILILGLVLFLGVHSTRIFADGWRTATIARVGEMPWKGIYSVLSIAGFALLVWGYGLARHDTPVVWTPPRTMAHVTALLVLIAFVLVTAAYVPGNRIKAKLHHPMILGVKTWAFAHLLSNGTLADIVLFGAFLAWAVVDYSASRRRDRANGTVYPPGTGSRTAITVVVGLVAGVVFAVWLHGPLIGVRPVG
jgi:uncharacterized membrane protein